MVYAKISGLASYLPDDILDNYMLSQMVDTNDEWITTRVGIKQRHILKKKNAGSSYMGIQAVKKLLKSTKTKASEIDLLICATSNPDFRFPSTASIIAGECGLRKAYAYDIQAACAGFIVAMQDAAAYIRSQMYKKVIIVAAEKMSSMVNYEDRATCPLFGDGAGAMLIEPSDRREGIIDGVFHVDHDGVEHLWMPGGGSVLPATKATVEKGLHYVIQDGPVVYKNAVIDMLDSSEEIMKRNRLKVDDIDWFVPHQANRRIIEAVAKRIGIAEKKVLINIEKVGNTSAASIPICLDDHRAILKKGDRVILTAFGAGFTWGAVYVIWSC